MLGRKHSASAQSNGTEQGKYTLVEQADHASDVIDVASALLFVRRQKGIILSFILIGTLAAWCWAMTRDPVYTAQSLVKLEQDQKILDFGGVASGLLPTDPAIETEVNLVRSRSLLSDLVDDLYGDEISLARSDPQKALENLDKEPSLAERALDAFATSIRFAESIIPDVWLVRAGIAAGEETEPGSTLGTIKDTDSDMLAKDGSVSHAENEVPAFIEYIKIWLNDVTKPASNAYVGEEITSERVEQLIREVRINRIANNLDVEKVQNSHILKVSFTDKDPFLAAEISQKIADLYIDAQRTKKLDQTSEANDFLEQRLVSLEQELRDAELAIQTYIDNNRDIDPTATAISVQQMGQLTNMVVEARANRKELEARIRNIEGLLVSQTSLESVSEVLSSPYIANLWEQETTLQRQRVEQSTVFGERHPTIKHIDAEIENIRDRIDGEIARLVENLRNELNVVREREASIERDMERIKSSTSTAGRSEVELRRLEREAAASRTIYEEFLQRYKETREQQSIIKANASIVAEATPPLAPSSFSVGMLTLYGFGFSAFFGIGAAFIREMSDLGLRSGREFEAAFGVPALGLVPYVSATKRKRLKHHMYLLKNPLSAYAEAVRSVHTALRMAEIDEPAKVIQVTSSVPSEGKTTLSVSLAVAMALDGMKVCLIDVDLRHPSVGAEVGIANGCCLVTYLSGNNDWNASSHTKLEGALTILPILEQTKNAAPYLESERMTNLIDAVKQDFDFVILDGPPVLGMSAAKAVSKLADGVLFTAQWGKVPRDTVAEAIAEMASVNARIIGSVMSQVNIQKNALYGKGGMYNYYKKYGSYYME